MATNVVFGMKMPSGALLSVVFQDGEELLEEF